MDGLFHNHSPVLHRPGNIWALKSPSQNPLTVTQPGVPVFVQKQGDLFTPLLVRLWYERFAVSLDCLHNCLIFDCIITSRIPQGPLTDSRLGEWQEARSMSQPCE